MTLLTHTYGFRNCTALRSIKLPEGLLELSGEVFQNCPIQEIEFPNSLEKVLPNNTFSGTQIKSFKVTGNIVMWNVNIYPSNLESVIFEENGNDIDVSLSFQNGRPINTLVLPKRVRTIFILAGNNLERVFLKSKTPPALQSSLNTYWGGKMKIYVPAGCSAVYKSATNWSWAADYIYEYREGDIPKEYDTY